MIDAFYDRVQEDDLLSPLFPGGVSEAHREHVTTWWSEVLGGPADYTDRLGGYEAMLAHHRNLDITFEQRFRFASLMSLACPALGMGCRAAVPALTRRAPTPVGSPLVIMAAARLSAMHVPLIGAKLAGGAKRSS